MSPTTTQSRKNIPQSEEKRVVQTYSKFVSDYDNLVQDLARGNRTNFIQRLDKLFASTLPNDLQGKLTPRFEKTIPGSNPTAAAFNPASNTYSVNESLFDPKKLLLLMANGAHEFQHAVQAVQAATHIIGELKRKNMPVTAQSISDYSKASAVVPAGNKTITSTYSISPEIAQVAINQYGHRNEPGSSVGNSRLNKQMYEATFTAAGIKQRFAVLDKAQKLLDAAGNARGNGDIKKAKALEKQFDDFIIRNYDTLPAEALANMRGKKISGYIKGKDKAELTSNESQLGMQALSGNGSKEAMVTLASLAEDVVKRGIGNEETSNRLANWEKFVKLQGKNFGEDILTKIGGQYLSKDGNIPNPDEAARKVVESSMQPQNQNT